MEAQLPTEITIKELPKLLEAAERLRHLGFKVIIKDSTLLVYPRNMGIKPTPPKA